MFILYIYRYRLITKNIGIYFFETFCALQNYVNNGIIFNIDYPEWDMQENDVYMNYMISYV